MSRFVHTRNRKTMIALAVVVAVIAIVIPTCRMVGCSINMGGAMPFGHQPTPGFFSDCGGSYVMNGAPAAVIPAGMENLVLTLGTFLLGAVALMSPSRSFGLVRARSSLPPPQPDDPLGTRLRI